MSDVGFHEIMRSSILVSFLHCSLLHPSLSSISHRFFILRLSLRAAPCHCKRSIPRSPCPTNCKPSRSSPWPPRLRAPGDVQRSQPSRPRARKAAAAVPSASFPHLAPRSRTPAAASNTRMPPLDQQVPCLVVRPTPAIGTPPKMSTSTLFPSPSFSCLLLVPLFSSSQYVISLVLSLCARMQRRPWPCLRQE